MLHLSRAGLLTALLQAGRGAAGLALLRASLRGAELRGGLGRGHGMCLIWSFWGELLAIPQPFCGLARD